MSPFKKTAATVIVCWQYLIAIAGDVYGPDRDYSRT